MEFATGVSVYWMLLVAVLCSTASQLCQKQAALVAEQRGTSVLNTWFVGGAALLGLGLLTWLLVLSNMQVSVAYPVLSLNYVLVLLAARVIFKEAVPSYRWVGSFAIIAGISMLVAVPGA